MTENVDNARPYDNKASTRQELEERNDSLEFQVKGQNVELIEAYKDLEAFSYTVSHDLQTPLKAMEGLISILLRNYASKMDENGVQCLHTLDSSVKLMNMLIKDMLNFSRVGKAAMSPEQVEMTRFVKEIVTELTMNAHDAGAIIIIHDMPVAKCDKSLMRQVWVNLVGNALKYSSKREQPVIEIGSVDIDGGLVYYIKDNGAGFDMKNADKLFTAFQRMHPAAEFEGTGVGLATVHRIITMHGGRIWAQAKPNQGATFYFTL